MVNESRTGSGACRSLTLAASRACVSGWLFACQQPSANEGDTPFVATLSERADKWAQLADPATAEAVLRSLQDAVRNGHPTRNRFSTSRAPTTCWIVRPMRGWLMKTFESTGSIACRRRTGVAGFPIWQHAAPLRQNRRFTKRAGRGRSEVRRTRCRRSFQGADGHSCRPSRQSSPPGAASKGAARQPSGIVPCPARGDSRLHVRGSHTPSRRRSALRRADRPHRAAVPDHRTSP